MSALSSPDRREPGRIGWRIDYLSETASTMDDVAALGAIGVAEGAIVVADVQTAGRGRAGRTWQTDPGAALLCSTLLRPTVATTRLSLLPLLVGVAVAEAIETVAPVRCQLKWPNDIWIEQRKVCGILLTSRAGERGVDFVVLGIGINISGDPNRLPPGATSLEAEARQTVARHALLAALVDSLQRRYDDFVQGGGAFAVEEWRHRAALLGERVTVVDRGESITGLFTGVAEDGALLLTAHGATRRIVAGDLSRGPVRAD